MTDPIQRFLQLSRQGATQEERMEAFDDMARAKIWPGGQDLVTFMRREAATAKWRLGRSNPAVGGDAEDMVQDALLTFFANADRIDRSVVGWLRGVLMILAKRNAEKHGPFNMASEFDDLHHVVLVRDDADLERQAAMSQTVGDAIDKLPKTLREVTRMHFLEGMSNPEIGYALNLRPGAVRTRCGARVPRTRRIAEARRYRP
ncbi:MAG: sigma-70 family RNA polymerase sigma factor [Candidatus Eisenbacteria bacterium]|nr:sigma-70 family RNA polymerase sigma factor [Candidatus Eisenbacteria bacterium]